MCSACRGASEPGPGGGHLRVGLGRAVLFAPGDQPRRIARALASNAESVVLDLEDAVAPEAKEAARSEVAAAVRATARKDVLVRVNPHGTPDHALDLDALEDVAARISGLVLPKAESAAQLAEMSAWLAGTGRQVGAKPGTARVVPVLETARGILGATDIAAAPGVLTLIFGTLDLAASLGVTPTVGGLELLHARSLVVLACQAAGLPAPLDGPHANLDDERGLADSCRSARALGFGGRVVIHPAQIEAVQAAYAPSAGEIARARAVVEAFHRAVERGQGVARLSDGTLVEKPVVAWARRLLSLAE